MTQRGKGRAFQDCRHENTDGIRMFRCAWCQPVLLAEPTADAVRRLERNGPADRRQDCSAAR